MQTERSFIAVTSIALAIACGSDDREARQATAEYFDALRTGRWEAAWAMVTATDREALPLSGFVDYSQEEAQRHAKTSSTIVSVNISGSTARVAADVTTPDESSSGATRTDRETTNLVKENGAWKIDTDWSEEKAKTDLANKAQATFGEALLLYKAMDYVEANRKLDLLVKLDPHHEAAEKLRQMTTDAMKEIIAGKWRFREQLDPLTDKAEVFVTLTGFRPNDTEESRPTTLVVRCRREKIEALVSLSERLRGELYSVTGRLRFNDRPAQNVTFSMSDTGSGAFFRNPIFWLQSFMRPQGSKLMVELPTYDGQKLATFDLTGADVAIAKVVNACGGFKKQAKTSKEKLCWDERNPAEPILIDCPTKPECKKPWPEVCD